MVVYLDLLMLVNFLVDGLLLIAADRLCGFPVRLKRAAFSAGVGAVYAGLCMLPALRFLGHIFWRLVMLGLMSTVAFGLNRSALRRGTVFVLLCMALGGIALGLGGDSSVVLPAAVAVCALCLLLFRGGVAKEYVTVKLTYGGVCRELTALKDTGNTLSDPITGQPVLVVGADVAQQLLGLTPAQLLSPIETMAQNKIPGLRLIPYRSVGNANGMMLAVRMDRVCVGNRKIGNLVAFAPQILGAGEFQALAGGIL